MIRLIADILIFAGSVFGPADYTPPPNEGAVMAPGFICTITLEDGFAVDRCVPRQGRTPVAQP